MMKTTDDLRYPVGQFNSEGVITTEARSSLIDEMADAPRRLREAVEGLSPEQLDTPYRPGGWTVRQVVHHVPDSHLNSYVRFKLALTEDEPAIRTYHEELWAELPDSRATPIEVSLTLLDSLHERWIILLRALEEADFKRAFTHPEWGVVPLDKAIGLYAWHGRHHVAHVTSLRDRMGW
jgi:uncharacterized damage-inducible protein DinB